MLKDKVVLVTGSTRGIGRGLVEAFAKAGSHVIVNGRKAVDASFLKNLEETYHVKALAVVGDISKMADCERMKQEVSAVFGTIDILVNNAGITKDQLMLRMSEEDFRTCIDVNLIGTFNMSKVFLKDFMKKRSGAIINIASVSGVIGNIGQTNYAASKAGVIGFTKALAREMAPRNVTCNAIAPGFIDTEMTSGLAEATKEAALAQIPLKRFGTPEDIARGVMYLAQSPYVTGQVLNIDGGMVMQG